MSEVLRVRKTLVLGIGTTGKEVAERLAEHLNWRFGSFERTAWVRLLVLETEQPASILGDRVLHAGIRPEEYSQYLTQPLTAGSEFGFAEWQDGAMLNRVTNPDTGAGNLRMLGRLCLFHKPVYMQLQARIKSEIAALNQLTPQQIADGLGDPGIQVNIQPETVAYVVGTLCGGTCSGGAADLGYLLDVWGGGSVKRQAIFTVPHPNLSKDVAPRHKKNAYYALLELNHYQLAESRWRQRLPGYAEPFVSNKLPYDILRVVMPGGPGGDDVTRLNAMIGQYLAAAVGPAGAEIAANDANALNTMTSTESIGFMRPLFSTMGVAALEYPGEHIQRALTSRLQASTLNRWCTHRINEDRVKEALRLLGGTDFEALLNRLMEQNGELLSVAIFREVSKPLKADTPPRVEEVKQLLRRVNGQIESVDLQQNNASDALPTLIQVMEKNHTAFLENIQQDVRRIVDRFLFDLEGGPGFVMEILRQFMRQMEAWAATARTDIEESRQNARSLKRQYEDLITEVEHTQQKPMLFGKKEKLKHEWELVTEKVQTYLEAEIRVSALDFMQRRNLVDEMVKRYRELTATLLRRLEQMDAAFRQEAAELDRQWRDLAASSPQVNGILYFEPETPSRRGTVTETYFNLLKQRRWPEEPATAWDDSQKEERAQRETLQALTPLMDELTREEGAGVFDPSPGARSARERIPTPILAAVEARARAFFAPLRDQIHIADLAVDADIDTAIQVSEPRLGVAQTQVSYQLPGTRGVTPALQELAFTDLGPEGTASNPALQRLRRKTQNSMQLSRGDLTNSRDPFRLLLIREKHGFTFGQMEGVVRSSEHDLTSLQSAEHSRDFSFWHTRRDVDWVDPLTPPDRVEMTEETWLLALLLGRWKDGVLPWTPAAMDEIPARGWYQIVSGEFCVFYPEGTVDTSEREARLPLSFSAAMAKLLGPELTILRRSLNSYSTKYIDEHGCDRVVRVVDQGLRSLDVFGIRDLDPLRADRIIRRRYSRNDGLTRAYFDFKTENMEKGRSEFAFLRHMQGDPIPGRSTTYPATAYYCPRCYHPLGSEVKDLLDTMFRCPVCNVSERYWPA